MESEVVIEVKDLVKQYDDFQAVKGISFQVFRGEVFGLLGENGAGKTTTLETIEGLRKPTSGSTFVFGLNTASDIHTIKQRIGVQLQASAYFQNLTLIEILELFASFYPSSRDPSDLLEMVKLSDKKDSQVKELSGGMQQRFSLAAALVNDPEIVFFDEPTTGLDPLARQNVWELIRSIQRSGTTVILTSHYLEEVESLCERVGIMKKGELIALDRISSLIMQLDDPIRTDFLPASPLSEQVLESLRGFGRLESSKSRAGEYTLYLKDRESLRGAMKQLDDTKLDRLNVSTASLEDVFVKLTGGTIVEQGT